MIKKILILFTIFLTLILFIGLIVFIKLYIDLGSINDESSETTVFTIEDTKLYFIKKSWGISGGHEISMVTPQIKANNFLLNNKYNPEFNGLVCFTTDSKVVVKDNALNMYCHKSYIPNNQAKYKILNGIKVSMIEEEN